jgi:DNA transformation protein
MLNKAYLDFILDWLAPLGEITSRRMMGGAVLYCDGIVFALLSGSTFYLKVDDLTRPRFEALGLRPFQPFPDNPGTMQYYPPPAEFFEDSDALQEWGRAAVEVGKRASAKKKGTGRKTAGRRG